MYWKKLGPHIEEFIVFLTIVIGLNLFFLCTDAIRINWSTTVVLFVILLSIWLIGYVFTFIVFDILVVVDLITKNYITESARFLEQYIFRSTSYLDKCVYEKRNIKNDLNIKENIYIKLMLYINNSTFSADISK